MPAPIRAPEPARRVPRASSPRVCRRRADSAQRLESECTMWVRMLYASRAAGPQTGTVTANILATARSHNAAHGISGVLCQGQGLYLQVLEGERAEVNRLYARILHDPRHHDVQLLSFEEITERRYPAWSMAHVMLPDDDAMVHLQHPEFDPFSATGAFMLKRVDELVAVGHPIVGDEGAGRRT
jgi:hypothetical protein